jgi:hypothetical protein
MLRLNTPVDTCPHQGTYPLPTPNYSYEKRQRELAKKRKAEEKRQRKQPPDSRPDEAAPQQGVAGGQTADGASPAAPPGSSTDTP